MNFTDCATLGEIIDHLESFPMGAVIKEGFVEPHSYRGFYHHLAFAPCEDVTVAQMLAAAKSAVGTTYAGWKGGDYTMDRDTPCWLAHPGECGVPIIIRVEMVPYVLPERNETEPAPEPKKDYTLRDYELALARLSVAISRYRDGLEAGDSHHMKKAWDEVSRLHDEARVVMGWEKKG